MSGLASRQVVSWGKPVYRVWGKNFYRLPVWFSHDQASFPFGQMPVCLNSKAQENPYFSAFFSMSTEKDPGGISSVKVSFFYAVQDSPVGFIRIYAPK